MVTQDWIEVLITRAQSNKDKDSGGPMPVLAEVPKEAPA
jgi:hypothetical protein